MWNEKTMDALDALINSTKCIDSHPIEDEKFHRFILAVWDESPTFWDEVSAREVLTYKAKEFYANPDDLANAVERRMRQGTSILHFLTDIKQEEGRTL